MPNISCLYGPAFSITGDSYFSSTSVDFQVGFDHVADQNLVLAYEWYLDNTLIIGHNNQQLNFQINCGTHTIGVRILSAEGWSGLKNMQFFTCKVPSSLEIYGPDSLYEGSTATYYVLQKYTDGSTRDVTAQYTFTSSTGGSFNGNVFTAITDDTNYNSIEVTIGVDQNGVRQAEKQITINNTTPIVQVSLLIVGPDIINEGSFAAYTVISTYSDGSQQDLTEGYSFATTIGSFVGNILTIPDDSISGNSRGATISAAKSGSATLSKQITINDTTPVIPVSVQIKGPDSIEEGVSVLYVVISTYSDGTQQDLTEQYTFSATEGTFAGNILTVPTDSILGNNRGATVFANKDGATTLSKQITIRDITIKAGILVVDLVGDAGLNVIGLIDNAEISVNHTAVYTGNNFLPASSVPADAFVLASDYHSSGANWRFEFNLAKLVTYYPATQKFVMYIKGRSIVVGTISGSYSARTNDARMTMTGSPGSYIPSVTGGNNIIQPIGFSNLITGGANNSYNESDLSTIIKFIYDVAKDEVTTSLT